MADSISCYYFCNGFQVGHVKGFLVHWGKTLVVLQKRFYVRKRKIIFSLFLFVASFKIFCEQLSFDMNKPLVFQEVESFFGSTFVLEDLVCTENLGITNQEALYLFGIQPGDMISAQDFFHGIKRFKHKRKFLSLTFKKEQGQLGVILFIDGALAWTMRNLQIAGVAVGKQDFYPLYQIDNGDPFIFSKHTASLKAFINFLKKDGYLNAKVFDSFSYDREAKIVDVQIDLKPGTTFKIRDASLTIMSSERLDHDETISLEQEVKRLFITSLKSHTYTGVLVANRMKSIKQHLQKKGFIAAHVQLQEQINYTSSLVELHFTIDIKKGRCFEFFGNHFFSFYQIAAMINHFGENSGTHMLPIEILAQELIAEYHKKGFWDVIVDTVKEDSKEFFLIQEGERAVLSKIDLKGIEKYDSKKLVKKFFKSLINQHFDSEVVKSALQELLNWYKDQGFWHVEILQKKYLSLGGEKYGLELVVDETEQYLIEDIQIPNYRHLELEPLFSQSKKHYKKAVPFSFQLLTDQKAYLSKYFQSKGFLKADISYTLRSSKNGYTIIWNIRPGKIYTFGKTILKGSTKVPFSLLQQQCVFSEGQVWDKQKLQRSLSALRSLDLFERIYLQPVYGNGKTSSRDILLVVQEDLPFEVRMRLGYQQVSKNFAFKKGSSYKAGSTVIFKNPFNMADKLIFEMNATRFERAIHGGYQLPFFFSLPLKTLIKGYATQYTQPVSIGSRKTLYQATQQGCLVGFSSSSVHFDTGCNLGFEWMETKNISDELARALHFRTDLVDKKIPYFFIEPSIYIDLLNDKLNPTEGMFGLVSLKGMFPLDAGTSYFLKFFFEQGIFVPIKQSILASRVRFGHIFRKAFEAIMPPERFYLGGANSLRGYQTDKCPPVGSFIDDNGKVQWVAQGGKTMVNFNFELRMPLKKNILYGVVFQDFGVLVEDPDSLFKPKKPLAATGFGFRYVTPIGPLRFDIGWKWHKETAEESSYAWYLTFGHAF